MRCIFFFLCLVALWSAEAKSSLEQVLKALPSSNCLFVPPEGWELTDPTTFSAQVKSAFVRPGSGFCPSMNLAVEKTSVSLAEYLKVVQGVHEQDRNTHWRTLGKVHTAAGLAQLTEIDTPSEWGAVRMLQLILLKEGHAYVLTAAALKKDFSKFYKEIQTAFRSLSLIDDVYSCISQLDKRELLMQQQERLRRGEIQTIELSSFAELGSYWQLLCLKQIYEANLAAADSP